MVVLALDLDEAAAARLLIDGIGPPAAPNDGREARAAHGTRDRIVAAAAGLLIEAGPSALSFRRVAERAGLSPSAPTYHFASSTELWSAAQRHLFERSKDRYRAAMRAVDGANAGVDRLAELTAAVLVREVTQYGPETLANYPIHLRASRDASLRPLAHDLLADQDAAWGRALHRLPVRAPAAAAFFQASFIGKSVRLLATGCPIVDLSDVRSELAFDLNGMVDGTHWTLNWQDRYVCSD